MAVPRRKEEEEKNDIQRSSHCTTGIQDMYGPERFIIVAAAVVIGAASFIDRGPYYTYLLRSSSPPVTNISDRALSWQFRYLVSKAYK